MEYGKSQNNIDLSGYASSKKIAGGNFGLTVGRRPKKNKIYIILIAVCTVIGLFFWGIYFSQNASVFGLRGSGGIPLI